MSKPRENWVELKNMAEFEEDGPLCCCEYYNIKKQRTHLLTFCCECDELDKAVDDWLKGNPQTLEKLTTIVDSFNDRCRLPWFGGAQPFDTGILFPPLILIFSAQLACLHFVLTILVFLALPAIVLCCYVFTIRVKMRTRFFLSLSLSSTIGCFAVYFYYVAPSKPLHINILLLASAITMAICFHISRRKSSHYFMSFKNDFSHDTRDRVINLENNSSFPTFCEDCSHNIPPRAKHCRICKECVLKYDHHCVWIDCCIGYHNRRIFLFTIFLYLVNIVTGCYMSLLFVCEWNIGLVPDCSHVYNADSDSSALVFVTCCYVIVGGIALLILLIQQIILTSFNVTSYEWRHMPDQQSCWNTLASSPYNKGVLKNWTELFRM